jgi:hypothetical protein
VLGHDRDAAGDPLTAVLKIVWVNVAFTRPLAILMAEREERHQLRK